MNIIVTGASRGIGFELVRYFAKGGHDVLAISRDSERLESLRHSCLIDFNQKIQIVPLDLETGDFSNLNEALKSNDKVDILVNNAGFLLNKPFLQTTKEEWATTLNINLIAAVELTKHLIPFLKESTIAHIVNISSMGGFQGSSKFPGLSAYSASKGALAILTECLATELMEYSIKVNCLCLGAVNTDMLSKAFPGYKAPLESYEMASYIADFAIKGHRFMNGQIIPVTLSNP